MTEEIRTPAAIEEKETPASPVPPEGGVSKRVSFRRYSRSKFSKPLLIVLVLALVVGGIFLWRYFGTYESTDDAQVDVHLYPVSARVSGYIAKVNVVDNQSVQAGTVLVEIDPRDYQVAVAKAQAELDNAVATALSLNIAVPIASVNTASQLRVSTSDVSNANAGIIAAEKQAAAAQAQVEQAAANDVKTQDDLQRYKRLVEKQNVSQQIYDQAVAAARASTANVAAARANEAASQQAVQQARNKLSEAEANQRTAQTGPQQVSSTRARAAAAASEVEQKRAALEQAQLNLQYTKVLAPVSGQVNKNVVVGLNVQAGQQLLTIVPLDEIWITANFKETQLKHMQPGQRVTIVADADGRSYKGHIDSVAGATGPTFSVLPPENATGNYVKIVQRVPVKIVLEPGENSDHQLRPGMSVEPKVHLQ